MQKNKKLRGHQPNQKQLAAPQQSGKIRVDYAPRFQTSTGQFLKTPPISPNVYPSSQQNKSQKRKTNTSISSHILPNQPTIQRIGPFPTMDPSSCHDFIFPISIDDSTVRRYQREIAEQAILSNTLVCLPTGLGKTLIAAVLIYNYYRWFHSTGGLCVFMAPTRQLLAQQFRACKSVLDVPREDSVLMTGLSNTESRQKKWKCRHVF
ncbi:MAG: putative Fanconi anemia group M protein, partial [Streblomastix strix]